MIKSAIFVLLLLLSLKGKSQETGKLAPDLLSVVVSHPVKAADWYRIHLGFDTVRVIRVPGADSLTIVFLKKDSFLLELVHKKSVFPINDLKPDYQRFSNPQLLGFNKISFRVNGIEAWLRRLKDLNVTMYLPLIEDPGFNLRTFIIGDLDGNLIQFVEYNKPK